MTLAENAGLHRTDYEYMGLAVPGYAPTRADDPPRERRFLLTLLLKHWDGAYTVDVSLTGELSRLEAIRGGRLVRDHAENTFDDYLAAKTPGIDSGGAVGGGLQSQHGSAFELDADTASAATHKHAAVPERTERSAEVSIRLDELDGGGDVDDDEHPPVRIHGVPYHSLLLAGRGSIDTIHSVHCTMVTLPAPPPRPPRWNPPPPPDAPWRLERGGAAGGADDDPWAIIEKSTRERTSQQVSSTDAAMEIARHQKLRGFTGMLPKHVRDQLQAGLEGIEPVIYAGFTLSFLLVCTLCVRRLCCTGRDGEDSRQHVGGRRADNAEAVRFKEPAIRMNGAGAKRKKEKRRPRTRKEHVEVATSEPEAEEA